MLLVCLVGCEGCIMQPVPFSVNGRYKLYRIETPKLSITEFKSVEVMFIPPINNSQYPQNLEIYLDKKLVKSIGFEEVSNDRKNSTAVYSFEDGTKRKFHSIKNALITSDFVKEIGGKEDTTLFYYTYISYPNLW